MENQQSEGMSLDPDSPDRRATGGTDHDDTNAATSRNDYGPTRKGSAENEEERPKESEGSALNPGTSITD